MSHSAYAIVRYRAEHRARARSDGALRNGVDMGASGPTWAVIAAVIAGLVLFDYFFQVRRAHTPTVREAAVWSATYVGIAILFGVGVWIVGGAAMGVEYFACYVSNEALSVDNLFVFLFII